MADPLAIHRSRVGPIPEVLVARKETIGIVESSAGCLISAAIKDDSSRSDRTIARILR